MGFQKATRDNIWAKLLLIAPSGGGKSYSALTIAEGIKDAYNKKNNADTRVAFIGSEQSRDRYYAKEFDYDLLQLSAPFTPESYVKAIDEAIEGGYKVLIIDSITHEWSGAGGTLDIHSKIPGNSYTAWAKVTPRHNKFLDKMIDSEIFVIATVRGKDDYVLEEVNGKQVPRKVALGYDQRKDTEYLFTAAFNIDQETHIATAVKDNTHIFEDKNDILTKKDGESIFEWSSGGDLDEKIKVLNDSIEEGKRKQAENEEKEAQELSKNRQFKSKAEKPKDAKPTKQSTNVVEEAIQEISSDDSASGKDLVAEIKKEFKRLMKDKKQKEILELMKEAGTDKPKEDTDPEVLKAVLDKLKAS
jgi:hypothetical protein